MMPPVQPKSNARYRAPALVLAAVVLGGGALLWYLEHGAPPPAGPVLTQEAKAYVRNLQLSEVSMRAMESALKQTVVEINGRITNGGGRLIRRVEINCVFYDPYGQLVLRERVPIVKSALGPGESRAFRLPFDSLPESWNQAMPQLVIAGIRF